MSCARIIEVLESEDGRLSMTRLLCFLSFFPCSYVLLYNQTETLFGFYIGTYAASYLGGKISDTFGKPKTPSLHVDNVEAVNVKSSPRKRYARRS